MNKNDNIDHSDVNETSDSCGADLSKMGSKMDATMHNIYNKMNEFTIVTGALEQVRMIEQHEAQRRAMSVTLDRPLSDSSLLPYIEKIKTSILDKYLQ